MEGSFIKTIIEKYGSVNKFIEAMLIKYKGKLPLCRQTIYCILKGKTTNPGIKVLYKISEMAEIPIEEIIKHYK